MRGVLKKLILWGGSSAPPITFNDYIASLSFPLFLKTNETSGTTAVNSGTAGATLNGNIVGATTLGQTGALGPNSAFLFDGVTSAIDVPNDAALPMSTFTDVIFAKITSNGEGNLGRIIDWDSKDTWNMITAFFFGQLVAATTAGVQNTNVATPTATNCVFFRTYDINGDKKQHFYRGQGGVVTEYTYSTDTASVGALTARTNVMCIGNNLARTRTFSGLLGPIGRSDTVLSVAVMNQITALAGL